MDEDISAINASTRNQKIINFFVNNKKKLIILISLIVLTLFTYFGYQEIKERNKIKIANKYNYSKIKFISGDTSNTEKEMIEIIETKDKTYAPLALYFLIDNNITNSKQKINNLFDVLIKKVKLDKEIKNLVIYKKALFNSEYKNESDLLNILNPIINSDSIWKPHALYLLGEYFFAKNEKQKSKEFFEKILILENNNQKIKLEAQKRIRRDFSE